MLTEENRMLKSEINDKESKYIVQCLSYIIFTSNCYIPFDYTVCLTPKIKEKIYANFEFLKKGPRYEIN